MARLRQIVTEQKEKGRLLFVNKKKQKNFVNLGRAGFVATGPVSKKFFAPLFFKKAAASFAASFSVTG
jgi:hypothetical protein